MDLKAKNKFWDLKPFWGQPWSIIAFGIFVLIFSWSLLKNILIISILAFIIITWWILFLIIAPNSYELTSSKK